MDTSVAARRRKIGVSVTSRTAARAVTGAIANEGAMPVPFEIDGEPLRFDGINGIVYDLAPFDDSAFDLLKRIQRDRPVIPVLLFPPPLPSVINLVYECRHGPNLRVLGQERRIRRGDGRLRSHVRWLLHREPIERLVRMVSEVLPPTSWDVKDLIREVLSALDSEGRIRVSSIAAVAGFAARTLERRLRADGLPCPKELIDWLTLAFVADQAAATGESVGAIGRSLQLSSNDLYRLRHRLSNKSGVSYLTKTWSLEMVLDGLARRCDTEPAVVEAAEETEIAAAV